VNSVQDNLWKVHDTVNDWIKYADTKAAAILAANGIMAGVASSNLVSVRGFVEKHPIALVALIPGAIAGGLSVFFCLRCLKPVLSFGQPTSLIFFAHIAQTHDTHHRYAATIRQRFADEQAMIEEVSHQVLANSNVACKKFVAVGWATWCFIATLMASGITLAMAFFV
jgi:Family of unknown function (DUF5706)